MPRKKKVQDEDLKHELEELKREFESLMLDEELDQIALENPGFPSSAEIDRLEAMHCVQCSWSGSVDETFLSNTGSGFDGATYSVGLLNDGRIAIGGSFSSFNGTTIKQLVGIVTNMIGAGSTSNPPAFCTIFFQYRFLADMFFDRLILPLPT